LRDPAKDNALKDLRTQADFKEMTKTILVIMPKRNANPLELKRLKDALQPYYDDIKVS